MAQTRPYTDIAKPIGDLLETKTGVPSVYGGKSANTVLKRFDWEYGPIDPNGRRVSGAAPPVLAGLDITWSVFCRAATDDECFEMASDLVTAVDIMRRGRRWQLGTLAFVESSGEPSMSGWSLEVPITITVPLQEAAWAADEETDREVLTTEGTATVETP